jgi:hypothetical protein
MKPAEYQVIEAYKSPYPEPRVFHKGEIVEIGIEYNDNPDWENWLWCESKNGVTAWAPKQYLDIQYSDSDSGTGKFNR